MKKIIFTCIAVASFAFLQAQTKPKTTPGTTTSDSTKRNHPKSNQDSLKYPKGYYKQPKDSRGKDSNKVGSTPK